ncbi:MAG: hypothetical protein KC684_05580 [Candidatus Omnitrophica bacterium]|nr:hypothetical protein [Candidatus Omnitrophota bacterium]
MNKTGLPWGFVAVAAAGVFLFSKKEQLEKVREMKEISKTLLSTMIVLIFLLAHVVWIYPAIAQQPEQSVDSKIRFTMDGENWKTGYEEYNDYMGISEYVLEDETVDDWTELITAMWIDVGPEVTVKNFVDSFIKSLKEKYPSLTSNIVEQGNIKIVFEWQNHAFPYQHEIKKIEKKGSLILSTSYVKKTEQLEDNKRALWISIISTAQMQ